MSQEDVTNDIEPIGVPRKSAPSQDTGISANPSTAVKDDGDNISHFLSAMTRLMAKKVFFNHETQLKQISLLPARIHYPSIGQYAYLRVVFLNLS